MVEKLMMFGLTRQESAVYVALLQDGEMSGYEVAKITGISRSNTYTALAGLVDKGAAYLIEGTANKYVPVEAKEFCENKLHAMKKVKEELLVQLPVQKESCEGYITIRGKVHILDKLRNLLGQAEQRVYLSLSENLLKTYATEIQSLIDRNIKVVIITDKPSQLQNAIIYYNKVEENQIRVIVDSSIVLTGDVNMDDATCLYSKKRNFVDVFKEMLQNEIKIIQYTQTKQ